MTDPAQVTEHVPGGVWAALGTLAGIAFTSIASVLTKRTETTAQVTVAQVQAGASREADASARHVLEARLEAQADAAEHSLAVAVADRERAERLAIQDKHFDCLDLVLKQNAEIAAQGARITAQDKAIAECHEHSDDVYAWMKRNVAPHVKEPMPPPRPGARPATPANGIDIVRPVARKDTRREEP